MTARDDYPTLNDSRALDEIDRLRSELELCERRNEQLRKACDDAIPALNAYRSALRSRSRR